jgi:hypothetical protein
MQRGAKIVAPPFPEAWSEDEVRTQSCRDTAEAATPLSMHADEDRIRPSFGLYGQESTTTLARIFQCSHFPGPLARQTRGADSYQHLG